MTTTEAPASVLTRKQVKRFGPVPCPQYYPGAEITAQVRYDDECGNGHNTFAITAEVYVPGAAKIMSCGCLHEEVAQYFPQLAPFIKWHLVSSDGPMHYPANVTYHAGDRDCHGLKLGEKRQIKNGKTGKLCWKLEAFQPDGSTLPLYQIESSCDLGEGEGLPTPPALVWVPWCRVGEGKAREFDHARSCAVWPEATDEQLSVERPELEAVLAARLPQLQADFRAAVESLGFTF